MVVGAIKDFLSLTGIEILASLAAGVITSKVLSNIVTVYVIKYKPNSDPILVKSCVDIGLATVLYTSAWYMHNHGNPKYKKVYGGVMAAALASATTGISEGVRSFVPGAYGKMLLSGNNVGLANVLNAPKF